MNTRRTSVRSLANVFSALHSPVPARTRQTSQKLLAFTCPAQSGAAPDLSRFAQRAVFFPRLSRLMSAHTGLHCGGGVAKWSVPDARCLGNSRFSRRRPLCRRRQLAGGGPNVVRFIGPENGRLRPQHFPVSIAIAPSITIRSFLHPNLLMA